MSNVDVALPESIKIDNVPAIQAMLDEHVQSAGSLTVDAANVAHVDFCGIQFLLTLLGAEDHFGIH